MNNVKGLRYDMIRMETILKEIRKERKYQNEQWGNNFDDKNTANDWIAYITNYLGRSVTLPWNRYEFQKNILKVATLCVAALESLERNNGFPPRHYDGEEATQSKSGREKNGN